MSEERNINEANNDPTMVKVANAFARILDDIQDAGNREVTVQEVDAALQQLQVQLHAHAQESYSCPESVSWLC